VTIVRGTAATLAGRIANSACAVGTTLLLARLLGPSGSGTYTMIVFLHGALVTLASVGLPVANSYFIGKKIYSVAQVASNAVASVCVLGLVFVLGGAATIAALKSTVFREVPWPAIAIALAMVPVAVFTQDLSGVLLGANQVTRLSGLSLVGSAVLLVSVVALAAAGRLTFYRVLLVWAASLVVVSIAYGRSVFSTSPFALTFDRALLARSVQFGAPSYLTNIISVFNLRLDVFLVGAFVGTAAVGHYGAAVAIGELTWYGSSALATALYPRLTAAGRDQAVSLLVRGARHAFITTASVTLLLFLVGRPLIPILLGDVYRPSVPLLTILLPGVLLYGLAPIWSAFFTGHMGRPLISLAIAGVSLGLDAVLNIVLLPRFGVIAAAWSATIGYAVASALALAIVVRTTGLSWRVPFHVRREDLAEYGQAVRQAFSRSR
jgi:O-antigen/teichoic acid export membrane protein